MAQGTKRKRCSRPKRNERLELELKEWVIEMVKGKRKLSVGEVRRQALCLNQDRNFKASNGWVREYAKRWRLQ